MTANHQPSFLFLNGKNRWEGFQCSGLMLHPDGTLSLEPLPRLEGEPPQPPSGLPVPSAPAGVAIGSDGSLYFTDPDADRLLWCNACAPDAAPLPVPCAGGSGHLPTQFRRPRGLLFHPQRGNLFVADSDNHRIQIFDPGTFQLLDVWGGPGSAPGSFQTPWTLAGDAEGNVYVCDYGNKRVQKFSAAGIVEPGFWESVQKNITDHTLQLAAPTDVAAGRTAQGETRIYILDAGSKSVFSFTANGGYLHHLGSDVLLNPMGLATSGSALFVGDNPADRPGRVLQFRDDGAFIGAAVGYGGPVAGLCVDSKNGLWLNRGGGTPLRLTLNGGFSQSGFLWGGPFHNPSFRPQEWHWFTSTTGLPLPGAHIRFFVFASVEGRPPPGLADSPPWKNAQADISDWLETGRPAPVWMRFDPDVTEGVIPALEPDLADPNRSVHVTELWIGAELGSDGLASPALSQIRMDFDRETLLSHLPAIYSGQPRSRRFLGRWLSLFESIFHGVEHEISSLRRLFDPAGVRPQWLDWLGGWLAVDLPEKWHDQTKRRVIAEAFEHYRLRGTAAGLRLALAQFAGVEARVEEPILHAAWWSLPPDSNALPAETSGSVLGYTTMLAPAQAQGAVVGTTAVLDQSRLIGGGDFGAPLFEDVAHQFSLVVYRGQVNTEAKLDEVRSIIEREKPAHTAYHLCVIEPSLRVGFQARIGIDTVVAGKPAPTGLGQVPSPGAAFVLGGPLPGKVDGGARVGKTTRLSDAAVEGPALPAGTISKGH